MSPTGIMQSVRAGVLAPLAYSVVSAGNGPLLRKLKNARWGRDTNGSTFAWTAHGPRSMLQCGRSSHRHQQPMPIARAFSPH